MMKKIYLLIHVLLPFVSFAQPTITQSDLPSSGLVFVMATDSVYSAAIPAGGSSQVWDYTGLQNLATDTSGFFSSVGTPYSSQFAGANLASYNASGNQWTYFTSNSTGFYIDGFGSPTSGIFQLTPRQLFAPIPFTYGDTRNNTARIQIDTVYSGVNARVIHTVFSIFNADAWGTLNLPSGNYNNTLRMKVTELTTDTILVDLLGIGVYTLFSANSSQVTHYRWFHNGAAAYLLGVDADSLGTIATYSEYLVNSQIVSTNDLGSIHDALIAYPNPANQTVYLNNDLAANGVLIITNALGQEVGKKTVDGTKKITLDISTYPNGLFQFLLISESERRNGRFAVLH